MQMFTSLTIKLREVASLKILCNLPFCGFLQIHLTMSSFELEDIDECKYDKVMIRDGVQITSEVFGPYCGRMQVPAFNSTGNFVQIEFHSDMGFEYTGFKLDYTFS